LRGGPAHQPCEAPAPTQPGIHPLSDIDTLCGRDLAARNGRQNAGQHPAELLGRAQRRQIDPETLCRVDRSERR
jgi:hypothetical protein